MAEARAGRQAGARILVAGCGYLGTALGLALAGAGHAVYGLRRRPEALPAPLRPVPADLARPETLRALPPGIDLVFYTAAAAAGDDASYREAYADGLRHLVDALPRPPRRVLFTSSTGVYAQGDGAWVDEESPTLPEDFSGRRLLEGERLLSACGVEAVVLRLGGLYGPGRTRLVDAVRSGQAVVRRGPPIYTNRIHRDDAVGALVHLAFLPDPDPCYVGVDHEPAEEGMVLRWLATRLGVAPPQEVASGAAAAAATPGAAVRRGRSNKRCQSARLRAAGYRFRFPTFREGYDAVLRGMGLLLAGLLALGVITPAHAAEPAAPPAFTTTLHADHPLVGVVWDVAAGAAIPPETLAARLAGARYVLLGERHDQPDHHALQAWIVGALVAEGRHPVVAFEMLDPSQEAALRRHLAVSPRDAAGLGSAVHWEKSGWPAWTLYQPIAEAALAGGLALRSANLDRDEIRALMGGGVAALDPALVERLGLARPLPEAQRAAMEREIVEGHCGHAPGEALPRMVEVQRARDAAMAAALRAGAAEGGDGAVLIAGNGHVRRDHGVPARLLEQEPGARVASVAILEVVPGREKAADYAVDPWSDGKEPSPSAGAAPLFDYLWFTPRVDDEDACEKFRHTLEHMKPGS